MTAHDKHPRTMVHTTEPFNAGPPLELLHQSFITPVDLFFVRNHGPIPQIDLADYRLTIEGLVARPLTLTLEDLRALPKSTVTASLQCAGNRRTELIAVRPVPGELPWGEEAVGTAVWGGVALGEVLRAAGVRPEAQHAAFTGLDVVERQDRQFGFGSSIPIEKALSPEVLLAYEMNGEPLTPAHGFPLRVVAPGYIGARSVKWLGTITLQERPSENYFQARAYRLFAPGVTIETVRWEDGLMLGELSVNSVICQPTGDAVLPAGPIEVRGYATTGGDRLIHRVDLSSDGGRTWETAELLGEEQRWTWRLWRAQVNLTPGHYELVVRAWNTAANTQPEQIETVWNFKGYMNNAWHRVRVEVR